MERACVIIWIGSQPVHGDCIVLSSVIQCIATSRDVPLPNTGVKLRLSAQTCSQNLERDWGKESTQAGKTLFRSIFLLNACTENTL